MSQSANSASPTLSVCSNTNLQALPGLVEQASASFAGSTWPNRGISGGAMAGPTLPRGRRGRRATGRRAGSGAQVRCR